MVRCLHHLAAKLLAILVTLMDVSTIYEEDMVNDLGNDLQRHLQMSISA